MARTSPKVSAEIFKDRRVQLGLALIALLAIAGSVLVFSGALGGGGGTADTASADGAGVATPAGPGMMSDDPAAMMPGRPNGPGATLTPPAGPGVGGVRGVRPAGAGNGTTPAPKSSFADAPAGFPGGSGGPAGPAGPPAGPATDPFGAGSGGATGGAAANSAKPAPITVGKTAQRFRSDPFISFYKQVLPRPPAYLFAQPLRVASIPRPKAVPGLEPTPEIGPLPFVERRVSGILYNGSVSAILENGPPGPGNSVVVQPGSTVPSLIAGVQDLTVESIGPTDVTLRSPDNRRVQVKLTGVPGGLNTGGGGNFGGGPGGDVPGGPGPGGFGLQGGGGGGGRAGAAAE